VEHVGDRDAADQWGSGCVRADRRCQHETIGRIMDAAKRNGLIAHRWYGGDGEYMAVDEWPDAQSFQTFFEEAQPDIGPVMQEAGVSSQPTVTFWRALDVDDAVGWGA
jgi:hypothetical protein